MMAKRLRLILATALMFVSTVLPVQANEWIYSVRPGDNIWDLAHNHLIDFRLWDDLQKLNNIKHPKQMQPGTRLRIPLVWLKQNASPAILGGVAGKVDLIKAGTDAVEAAISGAELKVDDRLISGANGSAVILLQDGTSITLKPLSEIRFDRLTLYGDHMMVDASVRLEQGSADSSVGDGREPASRFEVFTRQAITAVRGTKLRTATSGSEQRMQTEVIAGKVELSAEGRSVDIDAGFGSITLEGRPPEPPVRLLPAPTLIEVRQALEDAPLRFAVVGLDAAAYRLEIAQDPAFAPVDHSIRATIVELEGPTLSVGNYAIRARGIDGAGLEGLDLVQNLAVAAWPAAPEIIKTNIKERQVEIIWSGGLGGALGEIQVARDQLFDDIVSSQTLPAQSFIMSLPEPGIYFARVRSVTQFGDLGEFGPTVSFRVEDTTPWYIKLIPAILGGLAILL